MPRLPGNPLPRRQGIYWLLTIPRALWSVPQSVGAIPGPAISWIRGQAEVGESGYEHWQIVVAYREKTSLNGCRESFPGAHAELTRSEAAVDYVWKESTRVAE